MKQVSQEEFESYIIDMIEGRKTQREVIKELQTESRTLNIRIRNLAEDNPSLYKKYISKRAYRPKERNDIDPLKLVLQVLEGSKTTQIADELDIGDRTFRRKIHTLETSNDPLKEEAYRLYKIVTNHNSRGERIPLEEEEKIEEMKKELRNIASKNYINSVEMRRQQLYEIAEQFNELTKTMSKAEAAKKMGYTTNRIYKLLNELYRIDSELEAKKEIKEDKAKAFRESMALDINPIVASDTNTKEGQNLDKGKEIVD